MGSSRLGAPACRHKVPARWSLHIQLCQSYKFGLALPLNALNKEASISRLAIFSAASIAALAAPPPSIGSCRVTNRQPSSKHSSPKFCCSLPSSRKRHEPSEQIPGDVTQSQMASAYWSTQVAQSARCKSKQASKQASNQRKTSKRASERASEQRNNQPSKETTYQATHYPTNQQTNQPNSKNKPKSAALDLGLLTPGNPQRAGTKYPHAGPYVHNSASPTNSDKETLFWPSYEGILTLLS